MAPRQEKWELSANNLETIEELDNVFDPKELTEKNEEEGDVPESLLETDNHENALKKTQTTKEGVGDKKNSLEVYINSLEKIQVFDSKEQEEEFVKLDKYRQEKKEFINKTLVDKNFDWNKDPLFRLFQVLESLKSGQVISRKKTTDFIHDKDEEDGEKQPKSKKGEELNFNKEIIYTLNDYQKNNMTVTGARKNLINNHLEYLKEEVHCTKLQPKKENPQKIIDFFLELLNELKFLEIAKDEDLNSFDSLNQQINEQVEKIWENNLKLVVGFVKSIKKYTDNYDDFLEMVQDGNLGLRRAIMDFDIQKGFKFTTYAIPWIRLFINRGKQEKRGGDIRLPEHMHEKKYQILKAENSLQAQGVLSPTNQQIADTLGWKKEVVEKIKQSIRTAKTSSLDQSLVDGSSFSFGDVVSDTDQDVVKDNIDKERIRHIQEFLTEIPKKYADVLRLRFGISPETKEHTLEELSERSGVTRERVRQIEREALLRIREAVKNKYKKDDLV